MVRAAPSPFADKPGMLRFDAHCPGPPPLNTLAQRLRQLRLGRNLNQIDVARAVGVDRSHLSKIETGDDTPGRSSLMALASFYHVSLDWLVTGQETETPEHARAGTEEEILLLACWRALPRQEAVPLLELLRARVAGVAIPD